MKKEYLIIFAIIIFNLVVRIFVFYQIPFNSISFSNTLNNNLLTIFFDLCNIFLLWVFVRKRFSIRLAFLSSLVYGLSFWNIYFSFSHSLNIFITFLVLLFLVLTTQFNKPKTKVVYVFIVAILLTSLFLNLKGTKDDFFFSNQATINSINTHRGIFTENNINFVGKILENKITYLGRIFVFNFLDHFSPVYYFTPQNEMLGFSFTPPMLVGFLVAAFFGLKDFLNFLKAEKILLVIFLAAIIPSTFSFISPNLEKLILLIPFISLLIALGLNYLIERKQRMLLLFISIVVCFQFVTVLYDLTSRESIRFIKYHNVK